MSKIRYKYCIVPYCKNTTIKTPQKLFFSVPVDEQRRREWCLAIGRVPGTHKTLSVKCSRFVCEDHFDLEEDMDNYMMWKMVGVGKLLLKKGILPHKLECQRKKRDVKKSDTGGKVAAPGDADAAAGQDRKAKLRGTGSYNSGKENNDANHRDSHVAIKTKLTESVCVSESGPNTQLKNDLNVRENYTFTVRYDSDTGGEYLIQNNFS